LFHKLPFKSLGSVRFLMSLKEIAFEHLFDKKKSSLKYFKMLCIPLIAKLKQLLQSSMSHDP